MSDGILTRYYTTTEGPISPGAKVKGGCGHLHPDARRAVSCALEWLAQPVAVDRAGRTVVADDADLIAALERAREAAGDAA